MPQALAFANGWNLATTLIVCVVVFQSGTGTYGVMPSGEYDGNPAAIVHEFDPFEPRGVRYASWTAEGKRDFHSRWRLSAAILVLAPWWWWKARPSDLYSTETTTMIVFGPLLVLVGIGFFCWLLFTLAVFALPLFVGLTIGIWACHTGAGVIGGAAAGLVAGGATIGIGQLVLAFVPWTWLRLLIILLYVTPASFVGYSATHGIAQMAMPSPTWQTIFAIVGAIAVSITAFIRFTAMAAPGPAGRDFAPG